MKLSFLICGESVSLKGEVPPSTAPPPEYLQPIDYTWFFVGTALAIIITIAIVGLPILRKK